MKGRELYIYISLLCRLRSAFYRERSRGWHRLSCPFSFIDYYFAFSGTLPKSSMSQRKYSQWRVFNTESVTHHVT